ncbi:MAG TPA: tyrosine-type recombinase/integrase, partial [Gemmata sp.]|nr:tyrosine-type recombinase/integrase [Gemmata sp.]
GRGRLVWTDHVGIRHERLLPGAYNSPESLAAKARLELELVTSPTRQVITDRPSLSVAELLLAYLVHAEAYYRGPDGKPTKELDKIKLSIRSMRELHGNTRAAEVGPVALKAVRQQLINAGVCRLQINARIDRIRRAFRWAASEELIPGSVYESLRTLPGLRRGRSNARESDPVGPVDDATVDATLPHLSRHVRAMVQLMRHTGMRPGEVCSMTLNQIERGAMWTYRPARHKSAHHGKGRSIPLGPCARNLLSASLAGRALEADEPIFSPRRAREERYAELRANRKSRVQPSQVSRKKSLPKRLPTERYTPEAIGHAVAVACCRAFPPPAPLAQLDNETVAEWKARLTDEQKKELAAWRREHRWHPYQLRHSYATRVRKEHGLEAAQVLLGDAARKQIAKRFPGDGRDERIAKYERHLHNLLTSTLHELERLQARREGEAVPPPAVADVNISLNPSAG